MPTVYTIGYTRKSLEEFIRLLQTPKVDAVIDVRLRNTSQLAGFSKRDDLAFLLRKGFGIEYEHRPELAPTADIFRRYRTDGHWEEYERSFTALLGDSVAEKVGQEVLSRFERPCLLCSEPEADLCHRRLVAEWWEQHLPNISVVHL